MPIRIKDHKEGCVKVEDGRFTRNTRKTSLETFNKSAKTDHTSKNNCVIDWGNVKCPELNRTIRLVKGAI